MNLCSRCGVNPRGTHSTSAQCEQCRRGKPPDYVFRKYVARDPDKPLVYRKANRLRQKGSSITAEDILEAEQRFNNACDSCGDPLTLLTYHLDHDHSTDKIRGFLCGPCNTGLGHFRDDIVRLEKAILYLKRALEGHA